MMCGRYGIGTDAHALIDALGLDSGRMPSARYNVAPGQQIPVVRHAGKAPAPELVNMHWGFIPSWDSRGKRPMINARSDKQDGRYWRKAFARRRCLIPASWWYEWQRRQGGNQPHVVQPSDKQPFFLAGVWAWPRALPETHRAAGQPGCAIVTRDADPDLANVHHRMPAVLSSEGARRWLDPGTPRPAIGELLEREIVTRLTSWPIGKQINDAAVDDPSLLETSLEARSSGHDR